MEADLSELGADKVTPERFPAVRSLLTSDTADGTYTISDKIGWQTDSLNARAAYGRVILQLDGTLTISEGRYTFSGTLTAPPDLYDFDKQPWSTRTFMGEVSTRGGALLPGKPFLNVSKGGRQLQSGGLIVW